MWEVLVRTPRGSIHPRKLSLLLATFLMVSFGYILANAPIANAAPDAIWDNQSIRYNNYSYDIVSDKSGFPSQVAASPAVYRYIDTTKNPNVVHFIYFKSDDPQSEKQASYVRYTLNPPNTYSNEAGKKTLAITPVPASQQPATQDENLGSCSIDGIGWLVCPAMQGIAEGMDFIFERIRAFLVVQPMTTDVDNPVYRIWQVSRDLANLAFVIGFLVIIYSYIVGGGFSGYEIRRILPRLVVAAILINISYVVCAAAVDLSNILGYGVNQLFETVRDNTLTGSVGGDEINWTSVTTWVLAGGTGAIAGGAVLIASVGGAAGGLWFLLAPFLLAGALVVMVTFLILAARQAVIVLAIAIAPLAFAAYILPNTEKWFERWRSMFFTMLVMFPAFAAVFGGAQLAGEMIIRMAAANGSIELIILGLGVMIAPLAITPLLLKLGGGILNRFAGIVNNPQKGILDRYRNHNRERLADHVAKNNALNAERRANNSFNTHRIPFTSRQVNGNLARRYAARKYATDQYRSTQRKLDEGAAENSWHNQTGRWGYDNHAERGEVRSRLTRRTQDGYGNLDFYKRDNDLRHGLTEAHHEEHWQNHLNGGSTAGTARRAMLTDTRLAEGRAKVVQNALEAQDERTFQTALNVDAGYANLRAMKVQTSVDTGVGDIHKAAVESAGKLALSSAVSNDRELRLQKVETYATEKQAEAIDNTIQKKAEANWHAISRNDEAIQQLRLQEMQASDGAKRVEEQWNTLVENIVAKGADAPQLAANNASLANSIMGLRQDIQIEAYAQESAKRVQQGNMSGELKVNEALRKYAGGIGGQAAANRIYAKAKKDVVGAYMEDVSNSRSVLSEYSLVELMKLHQQGVDRDGKTIPATDTAMRDAAMQEILLTKGNNWAFQKTKDYVSQLGMIYDEEANSGKGGYYEVLRDNDGFVRKDASGNPLKGVEINNQDEIDRRRDIQQLFVDAANKSGLKIKSFSGTDRGNSEVGTFFLSSDETIIRDIRDKKINANRLADTDVDELQRMVQILRDDDKRSKIDAESRTSLISTIDFALNDPQVRASIGDREVELMGVISKYLGDARQAIPMQDKKAYESSAKTKAPFNYQSDRVSDHDDGRGPDGTL